MPDDMRILVTTTKRASPDGVTVHTYLAGQVYGPKTEPPMPADLAAVFLREGWGEVIKDAANRKRSKSQKGIPKADKERLATSCGGTSRDSKSEQEAKTATAKASASGTNRGAACVWCGSPYTARKGGGGPVQRFCSDACRAGFHRGARRWAARELEAGRLDIAALREA